MIADQTHGNLSILNKHNIDAEKLNQTVVSLEGGELEIDRR